MDFLRSIGNAIAGAAGDVGNFLGLNGNDQQKKQQQAAQAAQDAKNMAQAQQQPQNNQAAPTAAPSLNLFQPGVPLQKVLANQPPAAANNPTPPPAANALVKAPLTPQQLASQAFLNANGGPVDPDYTSHSPNILDDINAMGSGIGKDVLDINHNPALLKVINAIGVSNDNNAPADVNNGDGAPATSLTGAVSNTLNNTDPQIGELLNPGSYAKGGAELVNGGLNLVKAVPGIVDRAGGAIAAIPDALRAAVSGAGDLKLAPDAAAATADPAEIVPGIKVANPEALGEPPATPATNPQLLGEPASPGNPAEVVNPQAPTGDTALPTPASLPADSAVAPETPAQVLQNSSSPENVAQTPNAIKPGDPAAAEPPLEPVVPSAMHSTETQTLNDLNTAAKTRILTPAEKDARGALQAKLDGINQANAPIEDAPAAPGANTAPNAPNVRATLTKQLGEAGQTAGDVTQHNVLSNGDLNEAAGRVVGNSSDSELLSHYSGVPDLGKADDLAHANATLPRLAELTKSTDPDVSANATKAIDNIMEGAEKATSGAGRTLNYAQSMYDTLPKEAKISLTIRTLDKARDAGDMAKIADDPAFRSQVEATLNNLLTKGEDIRGQLASVEGKIQEITDAAKNPEMTAPADASAQLDQLGNEQSKLDLAAKVQNGETARYYDSLVPGKAGLQKAADFARTSMLTAPSGRLNNVLNVGGNSLYELGRSALQGGMGKVVNAIKGPGTATDSSLLNKGLVSGAKAGFQKVAAQFKGDQTIEDIKGSLNPSKAGGTYGLSRTANNSGLNKIANWTHAALTAPSEVVGGALKQAQIVRSALQEGERAGLAGDDLKVYTQGRSLVPSHEMVDAGNQLKDQVSHMNKNPFANFAGAMFKGSSHLTDQSNGALSLLKNTFLPFPKYAATFAWNTLTDRNVVADAVRAVGAVKNGDIDGLTKAIAGAAQDGTGMYLGYHLANSGVITDKNAEGYNDSGMYFHIGNRYIPLGTIGVGAESLMAGAAYHDAVNAGGDAVQKYASTIGNTLINTLKSAGTQNIVGAGDTALTDIQDALTGKNGVSAADAGAATLAQGAGQFIPGAFSDANAVLNHSPLNPTGEAALTKATKGEQGVVTGTGAPSTAKDIPASALNSLENRIPILSQTLPRNTGVGAADMIDRVTRGDQSTSTELQKAADTQKAANISTSDKASGIPDPNAKYKAGDSFANSLETTIEKGNYDAASKGLQQKLDKMNADDTTPQTVKEPVQNQIKQLSVLKTGNFDPTIRSLYDKTSVAAWRNMGDSTKSTYDPVTYEKLYEYDTALAKSGIAGISSSGTVQADPSINKFTAKTSTSKGGAGSGIGTLKAPTQIAPVTLSLAPQKINAVPVPAMAKLTPETLIKNHAISVTKGT